MARFAYNNTKNSNTDQTPFELNCGYHPRMLYKDNSKLQSQSKSADKLLVELRELIIVCQENLYYAQKFQKRAQNKGVKPKNYALSDKVWLNNKYIKTKRNRKLKAKFCEPFRMLHLIGK